MITITKPQALQRWDLLTDNLREALWSEANSDFVWNTCASENIPEQMRYTVARISGYVLMGFIHPEDVSQELVDALNIDSRTAKDIQIALMGRIFAPLRADIDKVYAPLGKSEMARATSIQVPAGPKIIQDIGAPAPSTPPPPGMRPQVSLTPPPAGAAPSASGPLSSTSIASTKGPSVSMPGLAKAAAAVPAPSKNGPAVIAAAPKPVSVSDVGWAKTQASGPVVKLDTSNLPPQAPATPPATPRPAAAAPSNAGRTTAFPRSAAGAPVGEFERMSMMKTAPAAPRPSAIVPSATAPAPAPAASTPVEPAPMMLHEDSTSKAAEKNAGFTLPKSSTNAEIPLPPARASSVPRPAVLELGGIPSPGTPKTAQAPSGSGMPGVVHYTEFKPSLSSVPTASAGPRSVNEITASAAATPKPAVPIPTPPQPPSPQKDQPQQGSVIVKNFP